MFISLERESDKSLTRQLYEELQLKITGGELPPGYKLPASRVLARELHISRHIITEVYETLRVEGYMESRTGSGSYVSSHASFRSYTRKHSPMPELQEKSKGHSTDNGIRFDTGIPQELFPRSRWGQCLRQAALNCSGDILDYGHYNGIPQLRNSLKQWLSIHKGISCREDQIMIFAGTHQAVDLLIDFFSGNILREDPHLPSIIAKGLTPWGDDFLNNTDKQDISPEALLVTSSHNYPLSQIMTVQKRIGLIEKAVKDQFYLIENDYDGELIYSGPVLSSLHLLAPEKVIHLGSFTGTMYPGLRLAYMIAPENLAADILSRKEAMGLICPTMEQLALARFIDEGYYDAHLLKLKKRFSRLYSHMSQLITEIFGEGGEILGIGAGQYITVKFPGIDFRGDLTEKIKKAGIGIQYAYNCTNNPAEYADTLVFSFGKLDREQLDKAVRILGEIIPRVTV